MAAEYDNVQPGSVVVKDNGHHERDHSFEAALIASGDDSAREATVAAGDAGRDLTNAIGDAARDMTALAANSDQHIGLMEGIGDLKSEVMDVRGHITDVVNQNTNATQSLISNSARENLVNILDQGSRGRETTLEAKSDLMEQHCETQKLVLEEGSRTREVVHAEAERTRELVRDLENAELLRELTAAQQSNAALELRIAILSGGGPLLKS